MLKFFSKVFFVSGFILMTMNACIPPQPIFSLDKIPLIPLPTLVTPSDEVLQLNSIKFIRISEADKQLIPLAKNFISFWETNTQHELLITHGQIDDDYSITLKIEEDFNPNPEAYKIDILKDKIDLVAKTAQGIFRGIKTLEQIVILSKLEGKTNFLSLQGGEITDEPSFAYRGAMLDVARHFFSVRDVKRYIDLLSNYKINFLHLHLSDDQGWRIEIKSWPKLTEIGGQTEVGGGDGGFYTQEDYTEIIKYASDRYITIVPEIDLPGHTNAALASYAELNCDGKAKDLYTGIEVGFSSLCVDKEVTYKFVEDVVREISEISPGPYFHIGGDESHVTPQAEFIRFMDRTLAIVKKYNKTPMGWYELITADIPEETLLQYWAKTEDFSKVIPKKSKILISASSYSYLDMKYDSLTPLGLNWAGYLPVKKAYEWDPRSLVPDLDSKQIIGLEAPLWSETLEEFDDIAFMAFPRILGYAEIGWTDVSKRKWRNFSHRLSSHGRILEGLGVKYYPSTEIDWK
ncbi:MAG: family 20 glycosylhydrolase [Bacteroidota bacterium]|nr:family 20 glycosylhydrolase [Bacteroidota bacterium]